MKLAANLSLLFTDLPLLDRVKAASEAGFGAVEIQFPYELAAPSLKTALELADVPLLLINIPAGDLMSGGLGLAAQADRQSQFDQALAQAVAYAECVRPAMVNLLAGRIAPNGSREQAFDTLVNNARTAAQAFSALGIKLLCEAINPMDMPGFLINTPEDLQHLLARVDHPNCAAQVDIYHFARQGFGPESLALLAGKIAHVQFADCPGRAQPGSGEVDFSAWLKALKVLGYEQWLGAEYRPSGATMASLGWLQQWQRNLP